VSTVRVPLATYRVQLNAELPFAEVTKILPYLAELGVSDVYAAPILQARAGSAHGYDVVDHSKVNAELGGKRGLEKLARAARKQGMGLLLDIVPNHMCVAGSENAWWMDVLENGRSSPAAEYFDIDWYPPKPELVDRVLLPVLGDQFGRVLERDLEVRFVDGGFRVVSYGTTSYPLAPRSWSDILAIALEDLRGRVAETHTSLQELESIRTALLYLPRHTETDPERVRERMREIGVIRRRLGELANDPDFAESLAHALKAVNGERGEPRTFDALERVLANQAYRLSFWRVAADEINYRRFFDINELAAIRVENADVFAAVHAIPLALISEGLVTGLRIDHVDGLFDPEKYLEDLASAMREAGGQEPYLVVEKILGHGESLPDSWPVAGTTGYDFLNRVSGVLVDQRSRGAFKRLAAELHESMERFEDVVFDAKRTILTSSMVSEITVLARRLDRISEQHRYTQDFTLNSLQQALGEVIASFSVYRTYVRHGDEAPSARDEDAIERAIRVARRRNPAVSRDVFEFIRQLLLLRDPEGLSDADREERREFVLKLQQITGPVMAKGVEDTAFYRYFPLAALNEVGGEPERFGIDRDAFHVAQGVRAMREPGGLSATATHDTKRGEDTRARLAVLSEIPTSWRRAISRWQTMNDRYRSDVGGAPAPNRDEEYLLYQTLVGAWPIGGLSGASDFGSRVQRYMEKALREAKLSTSWISPDEAFDDAVRRFIAAVLDAEQNAEFLLDFERFHKSVEWPGYWNGLSQVVLKVASPGVPDVYQGTELWDLSLVDPDNRRRVDFDARKRLLRTSKKQFERDPERFLERLARRPSDGRVKLWTLHRALDCRRRLRGVFERGEYIPLSARGQREEQVVAFARREGSDVVLAVVGRYYTRFGTRLRKPIGDAWGDTELALPDWLVRRAWRDALTGRVLQPAGDALALRDVLARLPVALLESHD
jgi:(1->4)-alpha-D-glucan 1-alpha-D-glucosylmutase